MGSLAPCGSNFLSDFRLEEETRSGNLFNQVAEQVSLHLSRLLGETAVTQTCHQISCLLMWTGMGGDCITIARKYLYLCLLCSICINIFSDCYLTQALFEGN